MKKKLVLFLYLLFTLFCVQKKIHASFFEPYPISKNFGDFGDHAYASQWDQAGTFLAIGGVNYGADLSIYKWNGKFLSLSNALSFGNGAYALNWSPNGQYLAVGGKYGYNSLMIYSWDGTSLTLTASKYHGAQVNAVAWSPSGNQLAVGGDWNYNGLALYNWNGSDTLTLTTSKSHGTQVNALAWHPDGTKLAIAGINDTKNVILYGWNGSELSTLQTLDFGTSANALTWTHTGAYLAVGGNNGSSSLMLYLLKNSTLTPAPNFSPVAFGTQVNTLVWNFDDSQLAIGGNNPGSDLLIYTRDIIWDNFNPASSSQTSYGNGVYTVTWSPDSNNLAVAGDNNVSDITIYTLHNYLNGTKNNVTLSDHHLFTDQSLAQGAVKFKNGCTVLNGPLRLNLTEPFSGGLDLRDETAIELENDLYLDANFTVSPATYGPGIYGQNHTIFLGNNLIIPDKYKLNIYSDTVIDGNGHDLILGNMSQFYIDSNITLTLKNLTLKNTFNTENTPPIEINNYNNLPGKLALDNVKLALSDDFYFYYGHLFIHNDVAITGKTKFTYQSPLQSFITKNATLYFAPSSTLDYAPLINDKELFALQDASSNLYLNGCSLHISHTGLRLVKGNLFIDNNVTFTSANIEQSAELSLTATLASVGEVLSTSWSTTGNYIAVGLINTEDENEIKIFRLDNDVLKKIPGAYIDYGTANPSWVASVAWRPGGNNCLAVGGYQPDDGNQLKIFNFNRTELTQITEFSTGAYSNIASLAWSPDGNYLAIGGFQFDTSNNIEIFSFDGTTLTNITGLFIEGFNLNSVAWNHDGTYLAVGGNNEIAGDNINIFSFNGTNLTLVTGTIYGTGNSSVRSVAWSPNGTYLAACGWKSSDDINTLETYSFNGTDLTQIPGACKDCGPDAKSVNWSPEGSRLALQSYFLYEFVFDGITLTQLQKIRNYQMQSISWKADGTALSTGDGVYNTHFSTSYKTASTGLTFGKSASGPNYDLNVKILNGAKLLANGPVKYDNVN